MWKYTIAAAFLVLFVQQAGAKTLTSAQLATLCASYTNPNSATTDPSAGFCVGYIGGVVETLNVITSTKSGFCLPENVNKNQLTLVVQSYMQEHPDKLTGPVPIIIYNALVENYPCS